jgi:hypothetical protein
MTFDFINDPAKVRKYFKTKYRIFLILADNIEIYCCRFAGTVKFNSIFAGYITKLKRQMDQNELNGKLKELNEVIKNLNNSKHNYSDQLEMYARDLFDILIDEIKNQNI